jgi:hypothetical protein
MIVAREHQRPLDRAGGDHDAGSTHLHSCSRGRAGGLLADARDPPFSPIMLCGK